VEISNTPPLAIGAAVGMAVTKQVLDQTRSEGAGIVNLIAANSSSQGHNVDARA
jgi:hypothetical protein